MPLTREQVELAADKIFNMVKPTYDQLRGKLDIVLATYASSRIESVIEQASYNASPEANAITDAVFAKLEAAFPCEHGEQHTERPHAATEQPAPSKPNTDDQDKAAASELGIEL